MSFPTLGANSIDLGGANMGALGADASTNVGVWWLEDVPPQPCTPEHVITEDVTEEYEYSYDEQQHFSHVVQFETQSSAVSDLEAALLDSFVKSIVAAYD